LKYGQFQVGAVKSKIQAARSDMVVERQKLIHSGKVLKDEQLVDELKLADADFIVCMITKEVAKVSRNSVCCILVFKIFF
jgi:UV excision repair protein RAD23